MLVIPSDQLTLDAEAVKPAIETASCSASKGKIDTLGIKLTHSAKSYGNFALLKATSEKGTGGVLLSSDVKKLDFSSLDQMVASDRYL